jgi:hypothetical protein
MTMNHEEQGVETFVHDYERDFGVRISRKDAERMLTLYDEIFTLFDKYSPGEGAMPPFRDSLNESNRS